MLSALDTYTACGRVTAASNQQVRTRVHERLTLAILSAVTSASSHEERQKLAAINGGEKYAKSVLQ
jgi:C4-dicarboxylate-specific signal transduction histidine kinase